MFSILIGLSLLSPYALQTGTPGDKIQLSAVIDKALSQNEPLLQAKEEIGVQKGLAKQTLKSIIPSLSGGGYWSEQSGLKTQLEIPILNLSGILGAKSAFKQIRSVESSYERKRDALVFDVTIAYVDAFLEQRLLELAKIQHESAQLRLASQQRKMALEEISKLDLKRAELITAKTEAQIVNREASLRGALGQLAFFLGENSAVSLGDLPELPKLEERAGLLEEAKKNRQDLKAQSISLQSARLSEQSAFWLFMPTLQANTSLLFPLDQSYQWQARLDLVVPLYDGHLRYGILDTAKARLRQEKQKKHLLDRQIALEIQGALVEITRQKELLEIQAKLVEIGQVSLKSAENRYAVGQATSLDVLDEQTRLFEAQNDFEQVKMTLYAARLRLAFVLGDPRQAFQHG